jgi:hypothetical protein
VVAKPWMFTANNREVRFALRAWRVYGACVSRKHFRQSSDLHSMVHRPAYEMQLTRIE